MAHKKNIYCQELQPCHAQCSDITEEDDCKNECKWENGSCMLNPEDRGSRQGDGTCSENVGGMHQVCVRFNDNTGEVFSERTGQSNWSVERKGKPHCLCLGAYSHYVSNPRQQGTDIPALDVQCDAIPETALQEEYLRHWKDWNGENLTQHAQDAVNELIEVCRKKADGDPDKQEGLRRLQEQGSCAAATASDQDDGLRPGGLRERYAQIFPSNNRNVGGHLWAKHILDRRKHLTNHEFRQLFNEYCPVSGSPVKVGRPPFRYKDKMALAGREDQPQQVSHCCWPCVCDLRDCAEVAVKSYTTKDGTNDFNMLVMKKNPCDGRPNGPLDGDLERQAPELHCDQGKLRGAETVSETDLRPIIGMASDIHGEHSPDVSPQRCNDRAKDGFRSGMGTLFRQACGL